MATIDQLIVSEVNDNPKPRKVKVEYNDGGEQPYPSDTFNMSTVEGQSTYVRQRLSHLGFNLEEGSGFEQSQSIKDWILSQL